MGIIGQPQFDRVPLPTRSHADLRSLISTTRVDPLPKLARSIALGSIEFLMFVAMISVLTSTVAAKT